MTDAKRHLVMSSAGWTVDAHTHVQHLAGMRAARLQAQRAAHSPTALMPLPLNIEMKLPSKASAELKVDGARRVLADAKAAGTCRAETPVYDE